MKSIKVMLAGIGYNVFGISCFIVSSKTYWEFFDFLGFVFSAIGIIMVIAGLSMNEK